MRSIDHPNVIQLFEVMETKKNLFLILEHASGGEVLDKIMTQGKLSEESARNLIRQIVSALVIYMPSRTTQRLIIAMLGLHASPKCCTQRFESRKPSP
jgi:serine/threonine protein kinase